MNKYTKRYTQFRLHIWKREQKKNAFVTIRFEELVGNKGNWKPVHIRDT